VWIDALTNYITAAGYAETGLGIEQKCKIDENNFCDRGTWPADIHVIGIKIFFFFFVSMYVYV
jgi:methionyl-tRNA synthetase